LQTTRIKAATVIIRILKESGILVHGNLKQLEADDSFWRFFVEQGESWFLELCLLPQIRRKKIIGNIK
jgi:hypothetical protein